MNTHGKREPVPANRDLTYPWVMIAAIAAVFLILAAFASGTGTLTIDQRASDWVQGLGDWSTTVANIGNVLGETPYALGLLVIALVGSVVLRNPRVTWFLVIAAIGRVLAMFLKELFDSPRPTETQVTLAEQFENYGFPSGHATTSAVLMGTLAFLAAWYLHTSGTRWLLVAIATLGVAITAFARIDVGAHWFTDTLGGALVGTIIVLVAANGSAVTVNRRAKPASPQRSGQTPAH